MSGGLPELGSKISLISKADIRYEGRLYTVDPQECTIALSSVRSFGTEDRETQFQIAPQSQIYDYILFRGSDIKDIRVVNNSLPHPNDPAIMQVQLPNGQHLLPNFPMATMHAPPHAQMGGGGYGNPFGNLGNIAANLSGGAGNVGPSMAPGAAFIVGNHQPQQQQAQHQQQPQQQPKPPQQQANQQQKQPSELNHPQTHSNQQAVQPVQQQAQSQQHEPQQQTVQKNTSATASASSSTIPPTNQLKVKAESNAPTKLVQAAIPPGGGDSKKSASSTKDGGGPVAVGGGGGGGTSSAGVASGGRASGGAVSGAGGRGGAATGSAGRGVNGGATSGGGGGSRVSDGKGGLGGAASSAPAPSVKVVPIAAALQKHKDQDMLAGASRPSTPISLISRKSPPADMGMSSNNHHQQQQQLPQQPNQSNQTQNAGHAGQSRDAGHKRQNNQQQHQQQHQQQQRGSGGGNNRNGSNDYYQQRDQGRNLDHYNPPHDGRSYHQRNNQAGPNRGWPMNRGPNPNMMRNHRGGGPRGRMPNQSFRPMGGMGGVPAGPQKPLRNGKVIKFEQDFDFEQANNKFEELRSQLSKLKVADEPKSAEQMNGETEKKDDSGNETGAGDHEPEDEEITVGYDKNKSFFDNISCEAAQDRSKNKKNDWRQERKLNSETFGVSSTRRGSYRGRGNYYNRNMGGYGGNSYNRGYRGSNNYRHRNNNRMGLNGGPPTAPVNYNNANPGSYPNENGNTSGASTSTSANATGTAPKNPTSQLASQPTATAAAASNNTPITKAAPQDSTAQSAPIAAAQ